MEYCFDPWVVRQLDTDDMGHEHWDAGDSIDYHPDDEDDDGEDDGMFEETDDEDEDEDDPEE